MHIKLIGSALALVLIATTLSLALAPTSADAAGDGVSFGAYAAPVDGLTNTTAIEKLEQQLGTTLPIVRTFEKWDGNVGEDKKFHRWIRDGGRDLLVSVKPERGNGDEVRWSVIANAQPGSKVHNEMVALATSLKDFDDTVVLGFHHEPEHKKNLSYGNSTEYRAAFRKLHDVFEQQGASNVRFTWIMTAWSFEVEDIHPDDRRIAEKWYPGDDVVDYISVQEYNWATCRDNNDRWESLEDGLEPFMRFARKHPSKQLMLGELGTPEGRSGQKAEWLDGANALFKSGEYRDRFAAILYFHSDDSPNGNPNCNWWLDSSPSSLDAARRLAQDSFYQKNLFPVGGGSAAPAPVAEPVQPPVTEPSAPVAEPVQPPVTEPPAPVAEPVQPPVTEPVPAPEPVQASCTMSRNGTTVTLEWTDNGERPIVRRNGKWLKSLTKGTTRFVDRDAPGDASYVIRNNGEFAYTCSDGSNAVGCTISSSGSTVSLQWTDDGGRHVIRRDGSWLHTVGSNANSHVDENAPDGATYLIRTRSGGRVVDSFCS